MNRFYILLAMLGVLVAALPGAATAAAPSATVFVAADASWVATGVTVSSGDSFAVSAHGQAITGPLREFPGARSGPDGQATICPDPGGPATACNDDGSPYGALVAKIGMSGSAFVVGSSLADVVAASGEVYLAVNDNLGFHFDNKGGFAAQLTVVP